MSATDTTTSGGSRTRLPHMEGAMTAEGRATYHVDHGPYGRLPCWCEIGHDHTAAEFFASLADRAGE